MEHVQIDSFLEYIALVEEGTHQFSHEQVKKLELIRTKVSELVKRVQQPTQPQVQPQQVSQVQSMTMEKKIQSFDEFVELNEKIKKSGSGFIVTNKSGKKILGKHPSKKKALAQLQAIEISKASK